MRFKTNLESRYYMTLQNRLITMDLLLSENLRQLLSNLDWSVPKLAKKSGVPSTTIQNWAEGKPPRDMRQVKQVADALNMSIDALCFRAVSDDESASPIDIYRDEIMCGQFEVVLRPLKKK